MVIYSTFLIGGKGIAADKLDAYPAVHKVTNAITSLFCSDGSVVERKGSGVWVVAYSSAYTAKVGDVVAVF